MTLDVVEAYRAIAVKEGQKAELVTNLLIALLLQAKKDGTIVTKANLGKTQDYKLSIKEMKSGVKLKLGKVEDE